MDERHQLAAELRQIVRATAGDQITVDDDGLVDLLHTNFVNESTTLLRNLGGGQFVDDTGRSGLAAPSREMTL